MPRRFRIATANINGIRAAHRRGFDDWLATRDCDVVTLQEVRCPVDALPEGAFGDYHAAYDPGEIARPQRGRRADPRAGGGRADLVGGGSRTGRCSGRCAGTRPRDATWRSTWPTYR